MVIRTKKQYEEFLDKVCKYVEKTVYIAEFKKAPKKRGVKANALLHSWIGCWCESQGERGSKSYFYVVKEELKQMFLPMIKKEVLGKTKEMPTPTSKLNSKEFHELLENIHKYFLENHNFYLPWPDDKYFEEFYQAHKI